VPVERYRLICTRTLGPPGRDEYRYTSESHEGLSSLLLALAAQRGAGWDAIWITPLLTEPVPPQLSLWKEASDALSP
jgi:hypothetical protein